MSDDPSIVCETDRLILRHLRPEDADAALRLWCADGVTEFLLGGRNPEKLKAHIAEEVAVPIADRPAITYLAVFDKATGEMVGDVGLTEKEVEDQQHVELVYVTHPDHWGRGIATEAGEAMCRRAFDTLGLDHLIALIDPANTASERVAIKLGFHHDGDTVRPSGKTMRVYVRAS